MELAMIGLGKMGLNMATRLVRGGHRWSGLHAAKNQSRQPSKMAQKALIRWRRRSASSKPPRVVWVMVPAGQTTDDTIEKLSKLLAKGDTVIDGGNSNYKDTIRHAGIAGGKGN